MDINDTLLEYWDSVFAKDELKEDESYKVDGKWITDECFNAKVKECLRPDSVVLDFGCGSGWGLTELCFTGDFLRGVGMDASAHGIATARRIAKDSGLDKLEFIVDTDELLDDYANSFDFILSVNTIDVLPIEVAEPMLRRLAAALKPTGRAMLCINPSFPDEFLRDTVKMTQEGRYWFKDGILRANVLDDNEWKALLSRYFKVDELCDFALTEREKEYPRRMFLLSKLPC